LNVSTEQLNSLLAAGAAVALDVRSAAEFAIDHIPGSINIPMEQIESRLADIPEARLVLICEGGKRAQIVADWLGGSRELDVLDGGMRSWRRAALPTLACAPCRWSLERQVRFCAGIIVLAGAVLTWRVDARWVYLPMLVGGGLTFAGLTNVCGMAMLLAKMPWNSRNRNTTNLPSPEGANCCT